MKNEQYENFQILFNNLSLTMLEHGHVYADKLWQLYDYCSPFNRLYFIIDGEGYIEGKNGQRMQLQKGNAYLVPLETTHNYICENHMEKFYIHFRLNYLPGRDIYEFTKSCLRLPMPVENTHSLIELVKSNNILDKLIFKSRVYEILSNYTVETEIDYKMVSAYMHYREVIEFVREHCSSELSIANVASGLGLNLNTLRLKFKSDFGFTLKHYIDLGVAEKAKELLLLTNKSLKDIAYELKFNDEFYFSRFFKKIVGVSPRQYRKNNYIMK